MAIRVSRGTIRGDHSKGRTLGLWKAGEEGSTWSQSGWRWDGPGRGGTACQGHHLISAHAPNHQIYAPGEKQTHYLGWWSEVGWLLLPPEIVCESLAYSLEPWWRASGLPLVGADSIMQAHLACLKAGGLLRTRLGTILCHGSCYGVNCVSPKTAPPQRRYAES